MAKRGGYENFGQREIDAMKDKLNYNPYGTSDERKIAKMLDGLDNWAMNYDGNMREAKAFVVMYKVKKDLPNRNVKPSSAAYSKEADAKKFLKSIEKDGGRGMIVKSNVRGMKVESTLSQIHKAQKGSYPVTIVASMLGKVVKQELVKKNPTNSSKRFRMMRISKS